MNVNGKTAMLLFPSYIQMFIACGVLYAIDSATALNTKIRLALDLYTLKLLDVTLSFTNPFRKTTTVGYNHKTKELYTWDKGNSLIYPVRSHEIGYNHNHTEHDSASNIQGGVDVYQHNSN
jgi:hypothetical protein